MRNVNFEGSTGQAASQAPSSSPSNTSTSTKTSAATGQHTNAQATQYRVARIQEEMVSPADELIFDLRGNSGGNLCVIRHYIGDLDGDVGSVSAIRAIVEPIPEDQHWYPILLDSGADASVFAACLLGAGQEVQADVGKLCDAQGSEIPVEATQDMEIRLMDVAGKTVVIRERAAISSRVSQPIFCYARLLENGWGIDGQQQALVHHSGLNIPIEMQNKSVVVHGFIRMMKGQPTVVQPAKVRVVQAEVKPDVVNGRIGWNLDARGCGLGRHFSDCFQDPTLVRPDIHGQKFRTTLVQGDDKRWYVLELNEPLEEMSRYSAQFYGFTDKRNVITFVTDAEKDPSALGFTMLEGDIIFHDVMEEPKPEASAQASGRGDGVEPEVLSPEAVEDADIDGAQAEDELAGQDVPAEGIIAVEPMDEDYVIVNGVRLTIESRLTAFRTACSFYGLSTSGSKIKGYRRVLDHQKSLELKAVMDAAITQLRDLREPRAPNLAVAPPDDEQAKHRLTHLPYLHGALIAWLAGRVLIAMNVQELLMKVASQQ